MASLSSSASVSDWALVSPRSLTRKLHHGPRSHSAKLAARNGPHTTSFLDDNGLRSFALRGVGSEEIPARFLQAPVRPELANALRSHLGRVVRITGAVRPGRAGPIGVVATDTCR